MSTSEVAHLREQIELELYLDIVVDRRICLLT
jgi:hypothetical protein